MEWNGTERGVPPRKNLTNRSIQLENISCCCARRQPYRRIRSFWQNRPAYKLSANSTSAKSTNSDSTRSASGRSISHTADAAQASARRQPSSVTDR
jgi:hypothetical protein